MTSSGMPMSAMTMSPARSSAGGSTSGSFGAPSVTVTVASMQSPMSSCVSADMPDGTSIDTTGMPGSVHVGDHRLEHALERRAQARPEERVDDEVALRDLGEVQLPGLLVVDLDDGESEVPEHLEVGARVAADAAERPDDEDRGVDAALQQRAGDDEAVAAVVARAAQHGHGALGQVVEDGLHRGHHLASRVLHQHDAGDPDLLDGATVGVAHLRAGQDSHAAGPRTGVSAHLARAESSTVTALDPGYGESSTASLARRQPVRDPARPLPGRPGRA
jgi:hypothetical protein